MAKEPERETTKRGWIRRIIGLFIAHSFVTIVLVVIAFVLGWGSLSRGLPALSGWHTEAPESEFEASDAEAGYGFDDYLAQEGRVFDELDALIAGPWAADAADFFCRYRPGSVCNPETLLDRDWNRSFMLESENPIGGALLVHGLSDAPYSLRAHAERLHAQGWTVIGLRVPGHGTCPRALVEVSFKDWIAAVKVAAKGLRARLPDGTPMILVGFSNGGALSVNYAVEAAEDTSLPRPDAVVLFSPMIGIAPAAELTGLWRAVALIPGFEKVAWSHVNAEIDPFKYSSWPNNASEQGFKMTKRVEAGLARLDRNKKLGSLPPMLAFQSAVDATVKAPLLISRLFDRLGSTSELVLFDVNRVSEMDELLKKGFENQLMPLLDREDRPFALTIVTNASPESLAVVSRRRTGEELTETDLGLAWPRHVFSLSHVCPPIPPEDPVYGTAEATEATGLPLGTLDLRGESGVLRFSEAVMFRQRYNPFYAFAWAQTESWLRETIGSR